MRSVPVVVAAVLMFVGASNARVNNEKHCELTKEDYSVFTALLQGLGGPEDPEEAWANKELLIEDATAVMSDAERSWDGWGFRSPSNAAPGEQTVKDFKNKVHVRCTVKPEFGEPSKYQLISQTEISDLFKKKGVGRGWQTFYKKHPNSSGFWAFSQPGFNETGTEALLYVSHSCGGLCGTGHLYFLTKENGGWTVKNRLMLWIS